MINEGIMSSNSNEWYTPKYIIDYIEKTYGKIILDPCSSKSTSIGVKNYTKEDNGLSKDWNERVVFVNPPYGREIKQWVKKSKEENEKHNNTIILLIPARTDTSYWHEYIFPRYNEIHFIKGRIKFLTDEGESQSAPFPSCLVVFNNSEEKIVEVLDFKKEV